MKFLIIRFSSIGDIVLTTPVVRCLKKQVPGAVVHYLIKPQFKMVMEANPYIDKFHVLQEDWGLMLDELKGEGFDYIIDLHHNLRTLRVKKALKVPSFSFNLETVASLGVKNDGEGMDYFIPENERVSLHDIPASHHAGFISMVIGASFYTKKLPVYKLQELCQKINHPVILLGAEEERAEGEAIASVDPIKVYNACGKFSLHESADLVRQSKVVIAHDTGLMHIAAALRKQVIAVWGSTTPSLGMVPYYGQNFLQRMPPPSDDVQVHKLWCRPCTKIGRHKCPQGHFKCMKNIDIDLLVENVEKRLRLAPGF
jgi:heptosyltransferase-2